MAANEFKALPETGFSRLVNALARLPVSLTVFQIGAHPDDEDNALVAYLAKGTHANTYYVVSTWGEGGQNEIGPELYQALGVLRSQELASARAIDGARQLYLGSCDFGFSKTATETLAKWGHEEMLGRTVRILRRYQPDIVLTPHSATGSHGHHQAVGILVLEAFDAAADSSMFPEQLCEEGLHPWQVKKAYVADSADPTVSIDVGEFSPVLGRTYYEIGQLARLQHKSQGMGGSGAKGQRIRRYKLVRSVVGVPGREDSILRGIESRVSGVARDLQGDPATLSSVANKASAIELIANDIIEQFSIIDPQGVAGLVVDGLALVRALKTEAMASALPAQTKYTLCLRLSAKEDDFVVAGRELLGTFLEVAASDADVVRGQTLGVTAHFWNCGARPVEKVRLSLAAPSGWQVSGGAAPAAVVEQNGKVEAEFRVAVARDASFTGAHDDLPLRATATWEVRGVELSSAGSPEVRVVPAVAVSLSPDRIVVPASDGAVARSLLVKLRSNARTPAKRRVELTLPDGWRTISPRQDVEVPGGGAETSVRADVLIPAGTSTGTYHITALARCGEEVSSEGYQVVAYPHIEPRYFYRPAAARIAVIDVRVAPGLKVGYVDSGFASVLGALRDLGVRVRLLAEEDLSVGDLREYDTIVLGVRAYLNRPDLVANNARLLEYVRSGGNLIVQYNRTVEWKPEFAPYPLSVSSNRVAAPDAPVTMLVPDHPVFHVPNRTGGADWDGWVQERGLYFPHTWDARYLPLVECSDPGEEPQRGAWLLARCGKGTYTYTAFAWYRQLEGLVPGAYRIFANMISLPKVG